MEGCVAAAIDGPGLRVGAGPGQDLNHVQVAATDGQMQGRVTPAGP